MFLQTAFRIAIRDLRSSSARFLFVGLAVAIGVAALTGVKGFGSAFRGMLLTNAKQLIAADLQAQTWLDPTPEQITRISQVAARYGSSTRLTETVSMALAMGGAVPQMISVKAVDPAKYPFYGAYKLDPPEPLKLLLPDDRSIVATPELLLRMGLKPGDELRLGGKEFRITGTVLVEPDRLASGFGPGMRALMSRDGLQRTGLIQFGSRAAQRFLFKLRSDAPLKAVRAELKRTLPRVFLTDYREGSPMVGKAIEDTTTFLSLISLLALVIGAMGVAVAMHSHLQQRMDTVAILKALGGRTGQIIAIYAVETLLLGLGGGLVGIALGALVQRSFPLLMAQVFQFLPDVPFDWSFSVQGLAVGVLAAVLFTLPPLLNIRNTRPNLVFRRNMDEPQQKDLLLSAIAAGAIFAGLIAIAAWLSNSWRMGFYFAGGLLGSLLAMLVVSALLLLGLRLLVQQQGMHLPTPWRHGLANLYRPGSQARSVLIALGIGVTFTISTYLLQRVVLQQVNSDGPGREGNVFLLDVRDTEGLSALLAHEPGVEGHLQLAGYIVSRMISKNGVPTEHLPLSREAKDRLQVVRVSVVDEMPKDLNLRQGRWWEIGSNKPQLAISDFSARQYGLRVGDAVHFQMAGRDIAAPISALFRRSDRGPIRFDLVFPKQALAGLPVVYFGAVRVKPEAIPSIERRIFDTYPTVTVMNLADVLTRIQDAVDQIAVVVRFLAGFAIFAGVIILTSSVAGTRYRRIREVAVLKALGATRGRIRSIFSVEFSVLGLVAGVIGAALASVFTRVIASRFLKAEYAPDWTVIVSGTLACALLANGAGWLASLGILDKRPLEVLREE